MRRLARISIQAFKSIQDQTLDLQKLNVFIGGNGSGKSNLIQTFRFLREIARGNLATYSLERGADNLLFYGRKRSPSMMLRVCFGEQDSPNEYQVSLTPTDDNSLIVAQEIVYFQNRTRYQKPMGRLIGSGAKEAAIGTSNEKIARYVKRDLESYVVYHFHDTSDGAAVKQPGAVDDNRVLRQDAGNLAAFLYFLKQAHPDSYRNIEDVVRQVAPFFDRFNLQPSQLNPEKLFSRAISSGFTGAWLVRGSTSTK